MSDPPKKRGPERDHPRERLRQFERERGIEERPDDAEPCEPPEAEEEDEDAEQPS
jgi:hypothetical protein